MSATRAAGIFEWRGGDGHARGDARAKVASAGEVVNRARGLDIDWAALLSKWRDLYRMALDQVIIGRRPWIRVDSVYREALDTLLERRVLSGVFTTAKRDELILGRTAWKDSSP